MKYIIGKDRSQFELFCLEEQIPQENEVRLIDLFVDSLPLGKYGFVEEKKNLLGGRPAYHPSVLLKLFIYGYMNRMRSSRQLEKECYRNLEVMWLMGKLAPDHNTISNFRRDNPDAIKKVFRATVELAKNFELIGGKLLAGDGSVFRAQNSKKNNYNQKKIDRQRQAIVEHPFGTIKRQWGFDHIMTKKTIQRASADIGLVFVAYNLRRIFNILSSEMLKKYLSVLDFYFSLFRTHCKLIYRIVFLEVENIVFEKGELKAA